jgi:glycosyltransferase involved in cell wall biosynthesis
VVYHGTLVPERLSLAVVEALASLRSDWRLVVAGYETVLNRGHLQRLVERATSLGRRENLELHGPLARADLFALASTCHVGLALVPLGSADVNMANMARASCKVFDYLASGAMVLVADEPEWRRTYVEPGLGLACDPASVDALAAAFRWCAEHPDEVSAMGRRGQETVRNAWNYERQFAPVERLLSAAVPQSRAPVRP